MKIGRKLAMKLLNVSKFVLSGAQPEGPVTEALDRGMLISLAALVADATAELERYEYAKALAKAEGFFWDFCDNYIESAKSRRYGDFGPDAAASASTAMRLALSVMLRMLAPYLAFTCEDVWSWWHTGSIHRATWPTAAEVLAVSGEDAEAQQAHARLANALGAIRKGKTDQKVSVGTEVLSVAYAGPDDEICALRLVERDLKAAVRAATLTLSVGEPAVTVGLKPAEA
jgi:valyl-tRNA synthetase